MRRLAFIDVLRGLAILAVMVHHLPLDFGSPFGALQDMGGRGVDLFFVLSGFLIGSTCLSRAETPGTGPRHAGAYWTLRSARIWPLYFLLLTVIAIGPRGIDGQATDVLRGWPAYYLFFISNDLPQATLELGVLWSLAIEEQFYLAVGLLTPLAARGRKALETGFVGMAIVTLLVALRTRFDLVGLHREHLLEDGLFIYRTYHSTLARIDQLGLGLLMAVFAGWFNRQALAQSLKFARASSWAAVLLALVTITFLPQFGPLEFTVGGLLFAAAVLWAQRPATQDLKPSLLERGVLSAMGSVGQLSFGLYLLHPLFRHLLVAAMKRTELPHTRATAFGFLVLWFAATWVVSWVSYRFLETPVLKRARGFAQRLLLPAPAADPGVVVGVRQAHPGR